MNVTGAEAAQFHPFAGDTSVKSAITLCQKKQTKKRKNTQQMDPLEQITNCKYCLLILHREPVTASESPPQTFCNTEGG